MSGLKWLWALVDLQAAVIGILGVVVVALAVSVNPPAKSSDDTKPPGDMMICIFWSGGSDIDLWATAPGQDIATGYSNKNGKVLDLVRDDLGMDAAPARTECQFGRGLPDGRWIVNIHGYRVMDKSVKVRVEVRLLAGEDRRLLLSEDIDIRQAQERTVAQFRLAGGKVVAGSMNSVYVALRSAKK